MIDQAVYPTETIFVIDKKLPEIRKNMKRNVKIIKVDNRGRGFNFARGVHEAEGEALVFLHSDTLLPLGWDSAIMNALSDKQVLGGGFSLSFDDKSVYLKLVILVSDLLIKLIGSYSGDRAMFIRTKAIKENSSVLEVPIMEDAELSKFMKKRGKVVLLKQKVTTSAEAFLKYGLLRNTIRIVKCSLWYAVGGDLQKIFRYYYKK